MEQVYVWARKKFSALPQIHLLAGQHMFFFTVKKQLALNALTNSLAYSARFEDRFTCYLFRKLAEQEFVSNDDNKDIIRVCVSMWWWW